MEINPKTQSQPAAVQNNTKQRPKKKLLIGLLVAAAMVLAGGAGAATFYVTQNNKPEKVLADAFTNTVADTLEKKPAVMAGKISFESKGDTPVKVAIGLDGKSSGENGQGSADITVDFSGKTYNIKTSAVVFGDEEFYVKVENLQETVNTLVGSQPEFSSYSQIFEPVIAKIDNRWIKVTKDDLKEFGMPDEEKLDKCTSALEAVKLSNPDKKALKKLFKENQFIVAGEELGSESISGEKSFHYKLDFNNQAAENFAKQVINLESFAEVKRDCELDEEKIADGFKEGDSKTKKDDVKPVVELWVGKKSRRPTKFRVAASDKEFAVDFDTTVKFDAKDVTIEKPSSSISITDLKDEIQGIMGQQTGTPSTVSGFDTL